MANVVETEPVAVPRRKSTSQLVKSYWDRMTPEQRAKEMHRRMEVARANRREQFPEPKPKVKSPRKFRCRYCSKSFLSNSGQLYHEKNSHGDVYVPKNKTRNTAQGVKKNGSSKNSRIPVQSNDTGASSKLREAALYAWGHTELFLHGIASEHDIAFDELAKGLADLIRAKTVR